MRSVKKLAITTFQGTTLIFSEDEIDIFTERISPGCTVDFGRMLFISSPTDSTAFSLSTRVGAAGRDALGEKAGDHHLSGDNPDLLGRRNRYRCHLIGCLTPRPVR
jgi:hypothetical protein